MNEIWLKTGLKDVYAPDPANYPDYYADGGFSYAKRRAAWEVIDREGLYDAWFADNDASFTTNTRLLDGA